MMNSKRFYRSYFPSDFEQHLLVIGETDLAISVLPGLWTDILVEGLKREIINQRQNLQSFILEFPDFASSHQPIHLPISAPPIALRMGEASTCVNVGPMASVAGFFAELVGRYIMKTTHTTEVIVENGGDIFLASKKERIIGVYAGKHNFFTGKIALKLFPKQLPCGICTSSGTTGNSFSYGIADAAVIVSADALLADATATATANLVKNKKDVEFACNFALGISGIDAGLVICEDQMALAGKIELVNL